MSETSTGTSLFLRVSLQCAPPSHRPLYVSVSKLRNARRLHEHVEWCRVQSINAFLHSYSWKRRQHRTRRCTGLACRDLPLPSCMTVSRQHDLINQSLELRDNLASCSVHLQHGASVCWCSRIHAASACMWRPRRCRLLISMQREARAAACLTIPNMAVRLGPTTLFARLFPPLICFLLEHPGRRDGS